MKQNSDLLHRNAPDSSPVALLLIDVINDLEFEGGEKLSSGRRWLPLFMRRETVFQSSSIATQLKQRRLNVWKDH